MSEAHRNEPRSAPSGGPSHRLTGPDVGGAAASAAEGVDCLGRSGSGKERPVPNAANGRRPARRAAFTGSYATVRRGTERSGRCWRTSSGLREEGLNRVLQGPKLALDHGPDQVLVDAEVLVNNDVPHADDSGSWNLRMSFKELWTEGSGGLPENPEMEENPSLDELVGVEAVPAVRGVALHALDSLEHVEQPSPVVSHSGTAS